LHHPRIRVISGEPARHHHTLATSDSSRTLVAIPARWGSTRFPGKPLHLIAGKPLVQHVWERCQDCKQVDDVIIATDDARIAEAATSFGAKAVLTDRPITPAARIASPRPPSPSPTTAVIINVQGDEPLISPALIDELARTMRDDPAVKMITAAAPIQDAAQISDPNIVKVIFDTHGDALYFSPLTAALCAQPRRPGRAATATSASTASSAASSFSLSPGRHHGSNKPSAWNSSAPSKTAPASASCSRTS
jgi:3-deoxy-manno-octulosonate cytidylyltransferase (CMP-KDO synthetase)